MNSIQASTSSSFVKNIDNSFEFDFAMCHGYLC